MKSLFDMFDLPGMGLNYTKTFFSQKARSKKNNFKLIFLKVILRKVKFTN